MVVAVAALALAGCSQAAFGALTPASGATPSPVGIAPATPSAQTIAPAEPASSSPDSGQATIPNAGPAPNINAEGTVPPPLPLPSPLPLPIGAQYAHAADYSSLTGVVRVTAIQGGCTYLIYDPTGADTYGGMAVLPGKSGLRDGEWVKLSGRIDDGPAPVCPPARVGYVITRVTHLIP